MNTLIVCLLIAIFLPFIVRSVVFKFMKKEPGGYNNNYPRQQQAQLVGIGARAVAAHLNGFESLTIFASAALTAMATNHVGALIQGLAIVYILSRIAYNIFYLKDLDTHRSISWSLGFFCCIGILLACLV